jgi:hypothetical protein
MVVVSRGGELDVRHHFQIAKPRQPEEPSRSRHHEIVLLTTSVRNAPTHSSLSSFACRLRVVDHRLLSWIKRIHLQSLCSARQKKHRAIDEKDANLVGLPLWC